jgi:hypothetical protein
MLYGCFPIPAFSFLALKYLPLPLAENNVHEIKSARSECYLLDRARRRPL